jgi:vacuolar protein sorting-associated protein 29
MPLHPATRFPFLTTTLFSPRFQAIEFDHRFFVNPGSATGAWTGAYSGDPTPSFALMDIQGPVVVTYVYQLVDSEVRVEKIEYRKEKEGQEGWLKESGMAPRSTVMPQSIPGSPTGGQGGGW